MANEKRKRNREEEEEHKEIEDEESCALFLLVILSYLFTISFHLVDRVLHCLQLNQWIAVSHRVYVIW